MISIYQLKPKFQQLLRPCVRLLVSRGFTANQVTLAAFALSCALGAATALAAPGHPWIYLTLPLFLFVRMALNAFDGMMAREYHQQSRLGAVLNEMGDILSDLALYLPFLYVRQANAWLTTAFAVLVVLSETAGIMAVQIGSSRRYDGPMGKSDRAFWFGVLGLLAFFRFPGPQGTDWAVALMSCLMTWSVWNRLKNALREGGK